MTRKNKVIFAIIIFLGLIGELILLGYVASAEAVETISEVNTDLAEIRLPRRSLNLVSLLPVTSEGRTVGIVAIYDDPVTTRTED